MSGGHFNGRESQLGELADKIDRVVFDNDCKVENKWGDTIGRGLSEDIIENFKDTSRCLRRAQAMTQRVDYLLSGDDGEDSFRRRWDAEVPACEKVSGGE